MASKANFTSEEWQTLKQSPFVAGLYITMASPSIGDSLKESVAVAGKVADAAKERGEGTGLMSELVSEFKTLSSAREAQPSFNARDIDTLKSEALGDIRSAAQLLDSKASAVEATEIKRWLYDVAVAAAEAAKEGDFLGIGGERVSEEERTALGELQTALGITA